MLQAQIKANLDLNYAASEAVNTVCSNLSFAGKNIRKIVVTSCEPNDGKSFVSMHIAVNMARRGKRVLLIDADLRLSVLVSHYQIWLEGDIYLNVDKMSTAAGLEIRMPLTDRRIFDIASRMPSRFKVNEEQNKVAFRTAAAKVLPEEIAFRKKLGFVVPIRIWLADERYNSDVRRRLQSESCARFFRLEEVQAIFDEYTGGNSDLWRKVWTIYTFLVWYDEYFS